VKFRTVCVSAIGLQAVSAMAVDWIGRNLYVLDVVLRQIIVCSLYNDAACTLLNRNISYGSLRSVAVDPAARYIGP